MGKKRVIKTVENEWIMSKFETHHTVVYTWDIPHVFSMACLGSCDYNCMPFPSKPEKM